METARMVGASRHAVNAIWFRAHFLAASQWEVRPALHDGWVHRLLIRRYPRRPAEIAWYLVYAPVDASLDDMVWAAGTRWTIEEVFKLAKGQVGLDQYDVRSWQEWHRPITLALAALATVAKKRASAASAISPSRSPNSGGFWSASSGAPSRLRTESVPGRAGAVTTSGSLRNLTAAVA